MEKKGRNKLYKESLAVLNTRSDKSDEKIIDLILDILPMTEKCFDPDKHWVAMSEDKKTEFLAKKQALVDDKKASSR